jgi:hypothetical protein
LANEDQTMTSTADYLALGERDYLALIIVNGMGSTHIRRETADTIALARDTAKLARRDWGKVYAIPKDHLWTVSIFDVTGHPDVYFDPAGVFDSMTNEAMRRHSTEKAAG